MQEVQKPSKKPLIFYGILTLLILLLLNSTLFPAITQKKIISVDYTEFMQMTYDQNIGKVQIEGTEITFTDKAEENIYRTVLIDTDLDLVQRVYDNGGSLSRVDTNPGLLTSILVGWILPLLPFLLIGYFLNRKMKKMAGSSGGGMLFGAGGDSGCLL